MNRILPIFFVILCGCGRNTSAPAASHTTSLPPGLFKNVTERAGIHFTHTNGTEQWYLYPETFGGGCAFLDYDGDGFIDILLLSCGELKKQPPTTINLTLYHNNGHGGFTDATHECGLDIPLGYMQGVAVGDYDNDGYPDIYIAGYAKSWLFHNEVSGTGPIQNPKSKIQNPTRQFRDVTNSAGVTDNDTGKRWASGAVWGDYDNDGKLDLFVIHYAVWSPETDKKCPRRDGSPGYCTPVVYEGDYGRLYHNEGNGRFKDVTKSAGIDRVRGRGLAATWLDYDQDGKLDLYVANDMDPNILFHNEGNGKFINRAATAGCAYGNNGVASSGMGIATADYDGTGRESLFVTNLNGEVYSLFQNEGGGAFTYASIMAGFQEATMRHSGWGTGFADLDRDGAPDLVCANGNVHPYVTRDIPGIEYEEPLGIYRNLGKGKFTDISDNGGDSRTPRAGRGLAIGDYDNDGRLDVIRVNRNAPADLLHNESPDKGNWISVRLIGVKSNRDGAGAKVKVEASNMMMYAECRLGGSYASSSDKRLFFGLGAANRVDKITVKWPSGLVQSHQLPRVNMRFTITEGGACSPEKPL